MITVKGHELKPYAKEASLRRAVHFKNEIISTLKKLGVPEEATDIPLEPVVIKKLPASATWYFQHERLYFSYNKLRFIDNIYVVCKVIELETQALLDGRKTAEEFKADFTEDEDVEKKRKEARKLLGVDENCKDLELITKKYKDLAKKHHPDIGGNTDYFKSLNNAHKVLKRELT